jgi:2,3-bisphosphoglycerate-independent phosphoglycerate mutase
MKFVVLLGDGMADYPIEELDGKTPLEFAYTPTIDKIARTGTLGLVKTIPDGFIPGSDVAIMSVLGYDPKKYYTGRAPIEAASLDLKLAENDIAFRCNFVTLGQNFNVMEDFTAGHISNNEARELIYNLNKELSTDEIRFYPGVSYRNLVIWKNGKEKIIDLITTAPHDIIGKNIKEYIPKGERAEGIIELQKVSQTILSECEINKLRIKRGISPANSIWLWGQGGKLEIPGFKSKYKISGSVISAVDLIKGLGIIIGLKPLDVPGITGYLDTNYIGKSEYALKALEDEDFVFVHVEAPDEASHEGEVGKKIKAIEDFDEKIVKVIFDGIKKFDNYKILILPDHPTPTIIKTHTDDPVPFLIYKKGDSKKDIKIGGFNEKSASRQKLKIDEGHRLMDFFLLEDN